MRTVFRKRASGVTGIEPVGLLVDLQGVGELDTVSGVWQHHRLRASQSSSVFFLGYVSR